MSWKIIGNSVSELQATISQDPDFKNTYKWMRNNGCGKRIEDKKIKDSGGLYYYKGTFENQLTVNIYPTSIVDEKAEGWVAHEMMLPSSPETKILITTKSEFTRILIENHLYINSVITPKSSDSSTIPPTISSSYVSSEIVPGLILDIISTSVIFLKYGFSFERVPKDLPNYRTLVEMKMIVSESLKIDEKFYEFLDEIREYRKVITYENKKVQEVKDLLKIDLHAVSNFMEEYKLFNFQE